MWAERTSPLFWIEVAMAHNCSKKCVISGTDLALSWAKVGDRHCRARQRGLAGTWQKKFKCRLRSVFFTPCSQSKCVVACFLGAATHTLHVSVICDPRAAGSRKLGGPLMTLRRRVVTHRQVIPTILDRSGNGPLGSRKVRDFRYRPRTFMGESG